MSCRLVGGEPSHSNSSEDAEDPPLRSCQVDCLDACGKGARIIEMACGTGKTQVMKELVANVSGRVSRLRFLNIEHRLLPMPLLRFLNTSLSLSPSVSRF